MEKNSEQNAMYDELDRGILDELKEKDVYADWLKPAAWLRGGIVGGGGYDIGVGKYLKLPMMDVMMDASIQALKERKALYWDNAETLPQLIAEKLKEENGIIADPQNEILLLAGMSAGMAIVSQTFLNEGDEVLVMDPGYVTHFGYVLARKATLKFVRLTEHKGVTDESRWSFDEQRLEDAITPKTKMLILCNPENPTGYVYSHDDLQQISEICIRHNLIVFANECYERLVYNEAFEQTLKFESIATFPGMRERTVTLQGVTKAYNLSGFRVGWLVAEEGLTSIMRFVHSWGAGGPIAPTISQYGVAAALTKPFREDYVREELQIYKKNRKLLCDALNEIPGVECAPNMGSQFVFCDFSEFGTDDLTLAKYLSGRGITSVYGSVWGKEAGKNHLRFTLANPTDYEELCVEKLCEALKEWKGNR